MTALPTLKMRVLPTFPSAVFGSGPVTVTKVAGVYTISFSVMLFSSALPAATDYATDYLLVYDSVAGSFFRMPLINFGQRTQRAVVATPIVVSGTDQILNCNINADSTCALPAAATRNGVPLTFKDLGHATAHNITITPNGTETIDGVNAAVKIVNDFGEITLVPFNDGVNTGWYIS